MATRHGAGILFFTAERKALFLKRGNGGDMPGCWAFPGGTVEDGETSEQTALREAKEELGKFPAGELVPHTRSINSIVRGTAPDLVPGEVDFTTFAQKVAAEFVPELNGEHVGYAWAPIESPPEPLHPGCAVALEKFSWDELGVARAIAAHRLTSPQRYANVWLFAMRITGTGVAYRGPKYDDKGKEISPEEFVYRRPENYLTDEFVARCNGLSVIMLHPAKALLNSKEYGARVVGAMMLPYIEGDEVWGIAKIYDDAAVSALLEKQMSTSPAVLLGNGDQRMKTEDGTNLLIEGRPSLLDHLAICERGVWDKGGEPSGVRSDNQGEIDMPLTDEDKKAIQELVVAAIPAAFQAQLAATTALTTVRADSEVATKIDKALTSIDAFCGRMDAFGKRMDAHAVRMDAACKTDSFGRRADGESDDDFKKRFDSDESKMKADAMAGGDTEDVAADKARRARKDAEESDEKERKAKADAAEEKAKADAEEKAKADANRAASTLDPAVLARLAAVEKALPKQLTDQDRHEFSTVQARADEVYSAFGKRAPFPLSGEDVFSYRRRMTADLKVHSPAWKDVDVIAIADAATFKVAEETILKDAAKAALHPSDLKENELREIVRQDAATGIRQIEFRGNHSFVRSMKRQPSFVRSIGVPQARA